MAMEALAAFIKGEQARFNIEGIPAEPGVYESQQFQQADGDLGIVYDLYYKYEDGAFHEGDRREEPGRWQKINGDSEAQDFGPFRKVRDLTTEEAAA